jgi:PAS domain-containing protein
VLVRGQHGEPDYWRGYYIDITEQKQAEEALRQALERERQAWSASGRRPGSCGLSTR